MIRFSLMIILGLMFTMLSAFGRSPAVDPTLSVDPQPSTSKKSAVLIPHKFKVYDVAPLTSSGSNSGVYVYFVLIAFITLPMVSWFLIERSSRISPTNKENSNGNVTELSNYQEQEKPDDIDKAS